jgi:hypothetical protein
MSKSHPAIAAGKVAVVTGGAWHWLCRGPGIRDLHGTSERTTPVFSPSMSQREIPNILSLGPVEHHRRDNVAWTSEKLPKARKSFVTPWRSEGEREVGLRHRRLGL